MTINPMDAKCFKYEAHGWEMWLDVGVSEGIGMVWKINGILKNLKKNVFTMIVYHW